MEGDRKRYRVRQKPFDFGWDIVDTLDLERGVRIDSIPKEKIISLDDEQVVALLEEVAKSELINKVLAKRTYDKDTCNRHLDIIEKLIALKSG